MSYSKDTYITLDKNDIDMTVSFGIYLAYCSKQTTLTKFITKLHKKIPSSASLVSFVTSATCIYETSAWNLTVGLI